MEINQLIKQNLADDGPDGYIIEVDLKYPRELHDIHNCYPLATQRLTIDETMMSPLQQTFPDHK